MNVIEVFPEITYFQRFTVGQVYLSWQDTFPYQLRRTLKRNMCARIWAHTHILKIYLSFKSVSVGYYMVLALSFLHAVYLALGFICRKKFNSQAALLFLICVNFVSAVLCAA